MPHPLRRITLQMNTKSIEDAASNVGLGAAAELLPGVMIALVNMTMPAVSKQARASLELARSRPICPRPHAPPSRGRAGRHTRQVGQPRRHAHAHAERLLLRPRRGAAARR
jgi:hypothetical protein